GFHDLHYRRVPAAGRLAAQRAAILGIAERSDDCALPVAGPDLPPATAGSLGPCRRRHQHAATRARASRDCRSHRTARSTAWLDALSATNRILVDERSTACRWCGGV